MLFGLAACAAPPTSSTGQPVVLTHQFPDVHVDAGGEIFNLCQSWTLGNSDAINVSEVDLDAGPAWHHSNWVFVPETMYPGDDGIWPCADRNFDESTGALSGGVLYAQSTQVQHESQIFPEGAVVVIPPHSKIVTTTHALNASTQPVDTSLKVTLTGLPPEQVTTRLQPLALEYRPLDLPPHAKSSFTGSCDLSAPLGAGATFHFYYVLAHYHNLGTGMSLEATTGATSQTIFQTDAGIGHPLGKTIDPPFAMDGATGLRFSCTFDNPRDTAVYWGIGDQEMCVLLGFTDSNLTFGGGVLQNGSVTGTAPDGTVENSGPCQIIALPAANG